MKVSTNTQNVISSWWWRLNTAFLGRSEGSCLFFPGLSWSGNYSLRERINSLRLPGGWLRTFMSYFFWWNKIHKIPLLRDNLLACFEILGVLNLPFKEKTTTQLSKNRLPGEKNPRGLLPMRKRSWWPPWRESSESKKMELSETGRPLKFTLPKTNSNSAQKWMLGTPSKISPQVG